jgi:hypothetical protein
MLAELIAFAAICLRRNSEGLLKGAPKHVCAHEAHALRNLGDRWARSGVQEFAGAGHLAATKIDRHGSKSERHQGLA